MFSTNANTEITSLERGPSESFEAYKARRETGQKAAKLARKKLQGGAQSSRHLRRHPAPMVLDGEVIQPKPMRGNFGRDVMAAFATKRAEARQREGARKAARRFPQQELKAA